MKGPRVPTLGNTLVASIIAGIQTNKTKNKETKLELFTFKYMCYEWKQEGLCIHPGGHNILPTTWEELLHTCEHPQPLQNLHYRKHVTLYNPNFILPYTSVVMREIHISPGLQF